MSDLIDLRESFKATFEALPSVTMANYTLPSWSGPSGEPLVVDVAVHGSPKAETSLVIVSGTHGIECKLGAALQRELPSLVSHNSKTSVVLVHALNPFGVAWCSRTNEDNVDVNRNFVPNFYSLPVNLEYGHYSDIICPTDFFGPEKREADCLLGEWIARDGQTAVQDAITRGQYAFKKGLFFGGICPCWSRQVLETILRDFVVQASHVIFLDIHTGLGSRGTFQLLGEARPHSRPITGLEFQTDIVGEAGAVSSRLNGTIVGAIPSLLPNVRSSAFVVEFGTVPAVEVLEALRAENWQRHHSGSSDHKYYPEISDKMRTAFAPKDEGWLDTCIGKGLQILKSALRDLEGPARAEL